MCELMQMCVFYVSPLLGFPRDDHGSRVFHCTSLYREIVHGEGKHKAGLQAGTPCDESHHKEKLSMERGSTGLACRQALQVMRVHETTHKGFFVKQAAHAV